LSAAETQTGNSRKERDVTTQAKKVLIVDDESDSLQYVQAVLEDDGFTFLTASDGEAALQKAREEKPDVIIMDVQMPRMDGFQAFYELRKDDSTRSIPVIMLTAVSRRTGVHFGQKDMGDFLGSEPEAFIDKPIDAERLRTTVRNLAGLDKDE
jgi:two-component system alkaline phosphatase synthesis response regulator PhoP